MTDTHSTDPNSTGAHPAVDPAALHATEATASADPGQLHDGASTDDALRREVADTRERMLRLAAEYDNFRKRAVKERQEAGWRAQGDLVRGLLDALDDLQRFAAVDPSTVDAKTVVDGIGLVEKKIVKSLAGHGFDVVNPIDHPFDPNQHEALGTAPAASAEEDGLVATVYQVGYVINGHLLRPARVIVKQWNGGAA
jgi:molecular chaperone GrpE